MDAVELELGDTLLRFDGGVVEVFKQVYDKSLRVPAAWVAVCVQQGRHDKVTFQIGTGYPPGPVFFGANVSVSGNYWPLETDANGAVQVREFFQQVAATTGRELDPG